MTVIYLYEGGFRAVRDRMTGIFRFSRESRWDIRPLEASELHGGLIKACTYWNAVGIIAEGGLAVRHRLVAEIARIGLPVVWCDVDAKRLPADLYAVQHDSRQTAERVLLRLLDRQDFKSYGFVSAGIHCEWSKAREEAFCTRMKQARRVHDVFDLAAASHVGTAEDCFWRLGEWLRARPRPCGIFAANDETGEFVISACRRVGLEVPKDIAVIGIDNDEVICENTIPALASVAPNFEESGYLAAQLLARRCDDPTLPPTIVEFGSGELVPRASIRQFEYADHAALKAVEFIRLNACRTISVQAVAAEMKTGRRSAEIRFRRQAGHSIQDEIDDVRFRTACELLRRRTVPLKTLHTRCGYTSARALRNLFLKKSGQTPTAWLAAQ